jgi:tRNA A-37 threonylcarbamoyl transferase component Bud32
MTPPHPSYLPSEELYAGCQLIEKIGEGTTSVVYKAVDTTFNNRIVAVKVYHKTSSRLSNNMTEVQAYSRLNHNNILKLYRYDYTPDNQLVLVMDYHEGQTLEQYLSKRNAIGSKRIIWIFRSVCRALAHAHSNGYYHNDIQPGNIWVCEKEHDGRRQIYLMDFGIASTKKTGEIDLQRLKKQPSPARDIAAVAQLLQQMMCSKAKKHPSGSGTYFINVDCLKILEKAQDIENSPYKDIASLEQAVCKALGVPYSEDTQSITLDEQIITATQEAARINLGLLSRLTAAAKRQALPWMIAALMVFSLGFTVYQGYTSLTGDNLPAGTQLEVMGGRVVLYDHDTHQIMRVYALYDASVYDYSDNGLYLAAGRTVLNRKTGHLVRVFDSAPQPVAIALSPEGGLLAIHDGERVGLWDVSTGRLYSTFAGVSPDELAYLMSNDGYHQLRTAIAKTR